MAGSTRRLLIVFGVLLVVTLGWRTLERRRTTSRSTRFARVDTGAVTRIQITGDAGKEVTLQRQGDRWMLSEPVSYLANQVSVEDLLEQVRGLQVSNMVSSNAGNHDLYEVGPDTGTLVGFFGGADGSRRLLSFYVGKITGDFGHTYVREFGSDDVYAAVGLLQGYFSKTVSSWRDRTILSLEPASIRSLSVSSQESVWTLQRGPSGGPPWLVDAGEGMQAADSTRATSTVRSIATLRASDFPGTEPQEAPDWSRPQVRITLTLADDSLITLSGIPAPGEETSKVWIRQEGRETVFVIYRSTLDTIVKKAEDLLPRPAGGE